MDHYGLQVFEDAMVQLLFLTARGHAFTDVVNATVFISPLRLRTGIEASAAGHHPGFKSL